MKPLEEATSLASRIAIRINSREGKMTVLACITIVLATIIRHYSDLSPRTHSDSQETMSIRTHTSATILSYGLIQLAKQENLGFPKELSALFIMLVYNYIVVTTN